MSTYQGDRYANPWKTNSSKQIYKNNWISVREDQVTKPNGQPGIYGVIETGLAVGVMAFTDQDELYLVGQYRYPLNCYSWEIIEGGGERSESGLATAQRELREEAGLEAENWSDLGAEFHLSNSFSNEVGKIYVARDLKEVGATPEDTEVLTIRKVPFSEALQLVLKGEITDSLSVIGIMKYALLNK